MITGINHVTLSVRDLAESFAFYSECLGFRPVARWSRGAYLMAGDLWVALIVDAHARGEALPEYTHVAFAIGSGDFAAMAERIRASGATIFKQNVSEGESLYFVDPNGHKLEIHATGLEDRLRSMRAEPWEGLELFV